MRETPFSLCFGVETMISAEIGSKILRKVAFDETLNDQLLYENLTRIDEVREQVAKRDALYK